MVPLALTPASHPAVSASVRAARPARPPGEAELAITGNLGYFPTARGVAWFLDEVWPEVARKYPRARLLVAGARPPRSLVRRVRAVGGRLVADPDDLPALLAAADLALAPLLAGSGTPIKLLEALAAGIPAVATPAAAEGLDPALARCVAIPDGRGRLGDDAPRTDRESGGGAGARLVGAQTRARAARSRARRRELARGAAAAGIAR